MSGSTVAALYRVPPFSTTLHLDPANPDDQRRPANGGEQQARALMAALLLSVWSWRRHVVANGRVTCLIECEDERNMPQMQSLFARIYDHDDIEVGHVGDRLAEPYGDRVIDMGFGKGQFTAALTAAPLTKDTRTRVVGDDEDFDAILDDALKRRCNVCHMVCYATSDTDASVRTRRGIAILSRLPPVSPQYA